jgi:iron-sulfur cluster repair protein YtfE (RIC family)
MLVAARTVRVNAAFLQEIKEDNVELGDLLQQLSAELLTRRPRTHDPRLLLDLLNRLRDQLGIHFSLEEAFGYFEDAVDVAPQLSEKSEQLRSEHDLFFRDICRLCDFVEQVIYEEKPAFSFRQIASRFSAFHDAFEQHEARERELIMDAFDDDIGVGD